MVYKVKLSMRAGFTSFLPLTKTTFGFILRSLDNTNSRVYLKTGYIYNNRYKKNVMLFFAIHIVSLPEAK